VLGVTQQQIQCLHSMAAHSSDTTPNTANTNTGAAAPEVAAPQFLHENA
jgi:flagellar biogenesis protein FliO